MRKVIDMQIGIGEKDISDVELDKTSRDEIPKVLIGLRHIWRDRELRAEVFSILEKLIPEGVNPHSGRTGMDLWKILVLGTIRLSCGFDYDKVKFLADGHRDIREMMCLSEYDRTKFPLQTIKDNVSLFTQEISNEISRAVVRAGQKEAGKKAGEILKGKADSFVAETDVHFPTDISLLYDAVRKVISLTAVLCSIAGLTEWRQSRKNILNIRRIFNYIRKLRHSTSDNEKKKEEKKEEIEEAHRAFMNSASEYIEKAVRTLMKLRGNRDIRKEKIEEIEKYIGHAVRLTDQIGRRVLCGEKIPHDEKIFSVFEEHTEWIVKGKAGVGQELGVRVCIVQDQNGFILHHRVMEKVTDEKIAVQIVRETQERFPDFKICSFDKGFYTPANRRELSELLDLTVLPKKGRLSEADKKIEFSEEFIELRRKHPAVESGIAALENHGPDRCPDHGIDGFKRYTALAVLARNLQILGHIIQQKELKREKRRKKYRRTWVENRAAA
jgi:IS5 family transposase